MGYRTAADARGGARGLEVALHKFFKAIGYRETRNTTED
jgi:hypothetical protein